MRKIDTKKELKEEEKRNKSVGGGGESSIKPKRGGGPLERKKYKGKIVRGRWAGWGKEKLAPSLGWGIQMKIVQTGKI